jgi:copper chaperone CopZ
MRPVLDARDAEVEKSRAPSGSDLPPKLPSAMPASPDVFRPREAEPAKSPGIPTGAMSEPPLAENGVRPLEPRVSCALRPKQGGKRPSEHTANNVRRIRVANPTKRPRMLVVTIRDMRVTSEVNAVTSALRHADANACVSVRLDLHVISVSPSTAGATELSDAIVHTGFHPSLLKQRITARSVSTARQNSIRRTRSRLQRADAPGA